MKKNQYRIFAILALCCSLSFAQQLPQFSQYMFNTISVNPAYAGSRETLSVVGLHRSQWVGLQGGPSTQTLSVHTPLKNEQIGLGVSIINDQLGYENFVFAYADASYNINLSEETKLAFGLKLGLTHYNLDSIGFLETEEVRSDPFFSDMNSRWNPNFGAGVFLHSPRWYVGLSAPRILKTDYNAKSDLQNIDYKAQERIGYYLTGGYVFDLNRDLKLKPSVLVKGTNGAPISFDVNANLLFFEKLWVGAGYRYNQDTTTLGALADFQVSQQLKVGYTYEHFLSDLRPYTSGTHEIVLMYELYKPQKRIKSPRYF